MDESPQESRACRRCGTPLAPAATWCSTCYRRSFHASTGELAEELVRAFEERRTYRSEPPARHREATPRGYSRWRASVTTFGPGVKVVGSVLVAALLVVPEIVVLGVILRQMLTGRLPENTAAYPFVVVMSFLALLGGTLLLRSIWRRGRVL